jgi:hypothetical protein
MEIQIDLINPVHLDILGELGRQRLPDLKGRHCGFRNEVGDLPERVNTGIGAARTVDLNRPAKNLCDRFLQRTLNRSQLGLTLPPVEVRSIVFQNQSKISHRCARR